MATLPASTSPRPRVVDIDTRLAEGEAQLTTALTPGLYPVALADCHPAADNLRRDIGDVSELAHSIREEGLLEPLVLTTDGTIVCGHRRHAAAQLAGLATVPAIVREMTDAQRAAAMLAENMQRSNLTAIEEARGFQMVLDGIGGTAGRKVDKRVAALARRIGISDERVRDRLALLRLPDDVQEMVHAGTMNIGDAVMLSKLSAHPDRLQKVLTHRGAGLSWYVKRELDDIEREEKRATRRRELVAAGVTVIDVAHTFDRPEGFAQVRTMPWRTNDVDLDPTEHAVCPHRAVALDKCGEATELCGQPESHPRPVQEETDATEVSPLVAPLSERALRRREMAERRESRLTVAQTMITGAHPCTSDVARFGLRAVLVMSESPLWSDPETVCRLCGIEVPDLAELPDLDGFIADQVRRPEDAYGLAAAIAVAEAELECSRAYGNANPFEERSIRNYFDLLSAHGYEPGEAELALRSEAEEAGGMAEAAVDSE